MKVGAHISLGSNLGDRKASLDSAIEALSRISGIEVEAVSPYVETLPVGGPAGQGAFLNAAATLVTTLDPTQFFEALIQVERRAGRVREVRWQERTLDLDLLLFGDRTIDDSGPLEIPHRFLPFRRFVLEPLARIAPEAVDPRTGRTVASLLAGLPRPGSRIAVLGRDEDLRSKVFKALADRPDRYAFAPDQDRFVVTSRWESLELARTGESRPLVEEPSAVVSLDPIRGEVALLKGRCARIGTVPILEIREREVARIVDEINAVCHEV